MIRVTNLVKEFKLSDKVFRAVDNVSFEVNAGSVFGIIGLSGAGKSTLIRCINRLEEPTDGKIFIDNINIIALNESELLKARKNIGMIFQSFNLFNQKNVFDNIAFPLKLAKYDKKMIESRVTELLKFIDLEDKKGAYPKELSGGQKQRVAIARALALNPKVLLCDEATSALDRSNTKQILSLLRKTVATYNTTIILITHQIDVAREICDRIAVMESGKIIEENDTEALFRNPRKKLTRTLVDFKDADYKDSLTIDFNKLKGVVFRIAYGSDTTDEPILSQCIKKFDIDINILGGDINKLHTTRVGHIYTEFIGSNDSILATKDYLIKKGLIVEEVKNE